MGSLRYFSYTILFLEMKRNCITLKYMVNGGTEFEINASYGFLFSQSLKHGAIC